MNEPVKKKHDQTVPHNNLRDKIIGLGESSHRKSYYPQLLDHLKLLQEQKEELEQQSAELEATVAELAAANKELSLSKERYRTLVSNTQDIITLLDLEFRIVYCNHPFPGFESKMEGLSFVRLVNSEQATMVRAKLEQVVASGNSTSFEFRTEEGDELKSAWFASRVDAVKTDGKTSQLTVITTDVTERVQAQEKISNSLKEKEVMLREIHHRVKNNLQLVSSLLFLQEVGISSEHEKNLFLISRSRIMTMALIHEKLYQSGNFSRIESEVFVDGLVNIIRELFADDTKGIKINTRIDHIDLSLEQAIPLGQIITELVTNSYKHAFSEKSGGTILISLTMRNYTLIELLVADNGKGATDSVIAGKSSSLGLELVKNLSLQIGGEFSMESTNGTHSSLIFPKRDA